jgi:hypothetical protein
MAGECLSLRHLACTHKDRINDALEVDAAAGPRDDFATAEPGRLPVTATESIVFKELIPRYGLSPFEAAEAAAIREAADCGQLAVIKPALDGLTAAYFAFLEAAKEASHRRQTAEREWVQLNAAIVEYERWLPAISYKKPAKSRKRNRTLPIERPLTPNETEALNVVGQYNGNISKAARQLGKDRTTVGEQYKNGLAKLGRDSKEKYLKSIAKLPVDNRGQTNVGRLDPEPDLD